MIATVVICCLIFSLIESQLILPAHLGHQDVKTEAGEIYLLMVPVVGILLLEFAWDVSSYIGLAVGVVSLMILMHAFSLSQGIATRLVRAQERFSERLRPLLIRAFAGWSRKPSPQDTQPLLWPSCFSYLAWASLAVGDCPFRFFRRWRLIKRSRS